MEANIGDRIVVMENPEDMMSYECMAVTDVYEVSNSDTYFEGINLPILGMNIVSTKNKIEMQEEFDKVQKEIQRECDQIIEDAHVEIDNFEPEEIKESWFEKLLGRLGIA